MMVGNNTTVHDNNNINPFLGLTDGNPGRGGGLEGASLAVWLTGTLYHKRY